MTVDDSVTVPEPQKPITEAAKAGNRRRVARYRRKLLTALWRGRVADCSGPDGCCWRLEGLSCRCKPGEPCKCERELYAALEADARQRFGAVLGGLATAVLVDLARASRMGDEARVRSLRLHALSILLADQARRSDHELKSRALDERQKRLELEQANRPRSIAELLGTFEPAPAKAPETKEDVDGR